MGSVIDLVMVTNRKHLHCMMLSPPIIRIGHFWNISVGCLTPYVSSGFHWATLSPPLWLFSIPHSTDKHPTWLINPFGLAVQIRNVCSGFKFLLFPNNGDHVAFQWLQQLSCFLSPDFPFSPLLFFDTIQPRSSNKNLFAFIDWFLHYKQRDLID